MKWCIPALALVLVASAFAQDGEPAPEEPKRDPFAATDKLKQPARPDFVPDDQPDALPVLSLRGYIEDAEGKTAALLEVEGTVYLVRQGDSVTLPRRGRNEVLMIKEVTQLSLRVEVGALRRVVVVR